MTNYEDEEDEIDDEVAENEPASEQEEAAPPSNNRNFILSLGIIGGVFVLILIGLFAYWLSSRGQGGSESADISATNQVIMTANAETAMAATQIAGIPLTPSVTPTASNTPVPPTATKTQVVALPSSTSTPKTGTSGGSGGGLPTVTPNQQTRTATLRAALTQNAQQTQTQAASAKMTGTATALPKTGFAEDVGLPGLLGLAVGLVLVIILVRRLRLSPNG
jgi:LPXTG-motif cell wall-anchored protein